MKENGHHHHHGGEISGRRLFLTMLLNLGISTAELVGGIFGGSLALMSDALHNFSDAFAVVFSWIAVKLTNMPPSRRFTFGMRRAETLAALVNTAVLMVVSVFLIVESIRRLIHPAEGVSGLIMMAVAGFGLVANVLGTVLLRSGAKGSLNIRATYLHLLGDAVTSVGVVAGGAAIYFFDWDFIDPVITLAISLYLIKEGVGIMMETTNILMMGCPKRFSLDEISARLAAAPEVVNIHHLHVWMINENHFCLEAHVELREMLLSEATVALSRLEQMLADDFGIKHATIQIEADRCERKDLLGADT